MIQTTGATSGPPTSGQHQQPSSARTHLPQKPAGAPVPGQQGGGDQPHKADPFVRKAYNEQLIYPNPGIEYSFEELKYLEWKRKQDMIFPNQRRDIELKRQLELAEQARQYRDHQPMRPPSSPPNRLSIVPQSLQPAQGDHDTSCYGNLNETPSVINNWFMHTQVQGNVDKFTVPIDQSQYIRENCPTSTPNNKDDKTKRSRRMSRPSMGGSPTMKLSPINETSRDCNSKSSSSSSANSATPATVKKPLILRPIRDEPDRPLDPNDPSTFRKLLRALSEPLDRRSGFVAVEEPMPALNRMTRVEFGEESYLISRELSSDSNMYVACYLGGNSEECISDAPDKAICLRADKPPNDWLFYICHELHRRLVKQKTKPDIELSVMNADPAIMYLDGSIFVDEYFRFVPLDHYLMACAHMNKSMPKSIATYLALELLQLVSGLHSCDVIHMNINPSNIIVTGIPQREDIASVEERTSVIKLIGFDRAMDVRLLPSGFKFTNKVDCMTVSSVLESRPWCHEIDWLGVLSCIHKMFFLEELVPVWDVNGKWKVDKNLDAFPTNVWSVVFDALLNYQDTSSNGDLVNRAVLEISSWVKDNSQTIIKDALQLDMFLNDFNRKRA